MTAGEFDGAFVGRLWHRFPNKNARVNVSLQKAERSSYLRRAHLPSKNPSLESGYEFYLVKRRKCQRWLRAPILLFGGPRIGVRKVEGEQKAGIGIGGQKRSRSRE